MVESHLDLRHNFASDQAVAELQEATAKEAAGIALQKKLFVDKLRTEKQDLPVERYRENLRAILTSADPNINSHSKYAEYYRTAIRIANLNHLSPEKKADKLRKGIDVIPMSLEMSEYIRTFPELVEAFDAIWKLQEEIK